MLVTDLITKIQNKFEGGNSFNIDWKASLKEGIDIMRQNINPETLKRRVPLVGGLLGTTSIFYAPADFYAPSSIYGNDGEREYAYRKPKIWQKEKELGTYTLEKINGVRFVMISHSEIGAGELLVDDMEAVGTKTGLTAISLNAHNFIEGSGALNATFDDSANTTLSDTLATAIDITNYLQGGSMTMESYIPDSLKITSMEFRLKTDASNYYKMLTSTDSIGDSLINGWNAVRFPLSTATVVGTPTVENILSWDLIVTVATGEEITIIIDNINMKDSIPFYQEYYSDRAFKDATTQAWIDAPVIDTDIVNLDKDELGIALYETARIVTQEAVVGTEKEKEEKRFEKELSRRYGLFDDNHGSTQEMESYEIGSDIKKDTEDEIGIATPSSI